MGLGWPGMRKKQLLDHDIIRLAGCVPQPPDSVPPHMVSHVGLASAGQQLGSGGAIWAAVEAHHLPKAAIVEGLQLCPQCLCEGPRLRCTVHEPRHQGFVELELGAHDPHPPG